MAANVHSSDRRDRHRGNPRTVAAVLVIGLSSLTGLFGPDPVGSRDVVVAATTGSTFAAALPGDVIVAFNDVRQRIDGFGASDKRNLPLTDEQADLFFSRSRGVGLSLLRAAIDPNGGYWNGTWPNATKAAARGAMVWGTPWSPPAAWKDNADVNNGGHLLPAYYDAWASQLANFATLLQQNAGVTLYGLSVQNEPDYSAGYASALYSPQQLVDFIKVLGPKLGSITPRPRLIAPDVANWDLLWTYSNAIMADSAAASYVDTLATHQYFAISPVAHAIPAGKSLWQTEMSSFDGPSTDIGNGITVAKWVHNAVGNASVNAWHYWWLTSLNRDNEGLLNVGAEPTKRLYTLGNFSKFIRPGFVRLGTTVGPSGVYISAYKDPATNSFAIVAINDSGASVPLGIALTGMTAASVTPWVTSATEDLAPRAPISAADGRIAMTLPAASVTTFVPGNPVPPSITGVSPLSGDIGTVVTITGVNFGATQGTSTITFNGAAAIPTSWSDSSIVAPVPADVSLGPMVVGVNGVASNGVVFTPTGPTASANVFDTFNGANGTPLSAHAPNTGGAWVDDSPAMKLISNRLEASNFAAGRSHNTAVMASADYEVSVDVTMNITGYANRAGVQGRVQTDVGGAGNSKYEAYFSEGGRTWNLNKWTGGNPTNLGSYADSSFTSGTKTLKLGMVGTTITVYVNGTAVIRVVDSSVQAAGYAGVYNEGGIHNGILLDNYLVSNGGTVTPPPQPPTTPTSPSPLSGSSGVSTTPTLSWSAAGASTYDVRLGTTPTPSFVTTTTSASYAPASLTGGTTYYWQIVANNGVGGTTGPVWSFTTAVPPPPATPSITSVAPLSGPAGTVVTIAGANFGATQGTSTVKFNGTTGAPTTWTATSIVVPVPAGATTGSVVVSVNGIASNGVAFTITTPSPPMAVTYVADSFTDASGTALASHTPTTGSAWVDDVAGAKVLNNQLEATNFGAGRSHNTTALPSADYEVSVDVTMNVSGWGNKAGVEGRVQTDLSRANTKYEAYFNESTHTWYLDKWTGGNPANLGSFADPGFTSGTKTLKLGMVGTTITVYVNGTSVIRVVDSSVRATGYAGIYQDGGIHNGILLDNYLVSSGGP